MKDSEIIELYFERSEYAVEHTRSKYGGLLRSIARRILRDERDAEEAVEDACFKAWNSIPPNSPQNLSAYLCRLCRNTAIDRAKRNTSLKRGGGEYESVLDELSLPSSEGDMADSAVDRIALTEAINRFLGSLSKENRRIFIQRYWYMCTSEEIAAEHFITPAAVRMKLSRMRTKLKETLITEGLYYE